MNLETNSFTPGDSHRTLDDNFGIITDTLIVNNNEVNYKCHLCHQHFLMKTDFENHLKLHGKQNQFHCPLCNHSYQTSTKLWNHLSKAHFAKSEGFQCSLCDNKAFKHAFNYHLHMLIHLEEQPEKCRFCAKTFRTKPSLRKHELIHTGQKPFHCPECNSKFKTKDELKQHSISHTTGNVY